MATFDEFNFDPNIDDNFDVSFNEDNQTINTEEHLEKPQYEYDEETTEKYRVLRLRKMDPIGYIELNDDNAFKFEFKWDPYTGERLEKDSNGPLYFDPDILIKYFYTKRTDKLWVAPKNDNTGYYEGYYDDGVGAGEDFFVGGRGNHPEWYLFRLPIIDCYLTKDNNKQFITFGPKLTDKEIKEIQKLAELKPDNYKRQFGYNRPSIIEMKKFYDMAITKKPSLDILQGEYSDIETASAKVNRYAVDCLVKMRG